MPGAADYYRALYEHCRQKPDAVEEHPWGDTVFKVRGRIFAFLGPRDRPGVTVKPSPDERDVLLELPYVRVASYVGRFGWVYVTIEDEEALTLALGLVDDSYDLISSRGKRRAKATKKG